jgi:hypothetical protein
MTLEIELGGTALGIDFDWIDVEGAADLDGDVQVTLINGFTPPGDSRYQFVTSSSRTGTFKSVTGAGGNFTIDYPGAPNFGARLIAPPAGPPPANTSPPFITGSLGPDQILTCNPGSWNPDGTPTKFSWFRVTDQGPVLVGEASPDANSLNNLFSVNWVGPGVQVFCRVTMTNGGGSTTAESATVTTLLPPANLSPPFITGSPSPGQILTCNPGTWDAGATPMKFSWFRVTAQGPVLVGEAAPDANSLNNLFSVNWVGPGVEVFCRVTMTHEGGSTTAESAHVTTVGPQPNPQPVPPSPEELLAEASPAAVAKAFGMPAARRCVRPPRLKISLKIPAGVKVKTASLKVRGKTIKLRRVRGRLKATVPLRGVSAGRLTVVLKVTTVSGKVLRGKRVYRMCSSSP